MIYEALQILSEQLDNYLTTSGLNNLVVLENIAMIETTSENSDKLTNKVVLTLLNLEEETTLKNLPNYTVINKSTTEYRNPPIHLNLFLLISGNCNTYVNSLRCISKTIEFFQGKKIFTAENTIYEPKEDFEALNNFKLITELYTPTFGELNYVWGTLGGRQLPSVIYKIQLVEIDRKELTGIGKVITEITDKLKTQ